MAEKKKTSPAKSPKAAKDTKPAAGPPDALPALAPLPPGLIGRLHVKNLGPIKEVTLDITPFTILIGPQASGKSTLAKLSYFFTYSLPTLILRTLYQAGDRAEEALKSSVGQGLTSLAIGIRSDTAIQFTYSSGHFLAFVRDSGGYAVLHSPGIEDSPVVPSRTFIGLRAPGSAEYLAAERGSLSAPDPSQPMFSSPSRSGLALLQVACDNAERMLEELGYAPSPLAESIGAISQAVLKASYRVSNGEIELRHLDGTLIRLRDASSGQKSAFWILRAAKALAADHSEWPLTLFIEEPELNLYPPAQKHLVDLFAFCHNKANTNFFLTTHSPYILACLNNLVAAHGFGSGKAAAGRRVADVIQRDYWLDPARISGYLVKDGVLASIKHPESGELRLEVLDEVSHEINGEFDAMLEAVRRKR